ncbi:MAG TPA: bifunctional nuclease family protein [Candidatus Kapabacteria bacterium]|nr:bifunctional nuclease family protein [Candidatus Kapabacteria bacterium]
MDKVQMEIIGLTASPQSSGAYALILQESGGSRRLSILIGAEMAQSIALEMEQIKPPRPVTHDLLKMVIEALGATLVEVTISELRDATFYATLTLDATPAEVDARPSDAIALAIRFGAPIYVAEAVMREAGIMVQEDEENEEEEEEEMEQADEEAAPQEDQPPRPKTVRETLQEKLDEAVRNEDYERAAQIRDEIERLSND